MEKRKNRFEVVSLSEIAPLLHNAELAGANTFPTRPRILSVSYDRSLAATREMLFSEAGFQVSSVFTIGEAIQLCAEQPFDLVVIGHSMPLQQRETLLRELRRRCSTPTLALHRHGEGPLLQADHTFDSTEGPELLLETVVDILKEKGGAVGKLPDAPALPDAKEAKRRYE